MAPYSDAEDDASSSSSSSSDSDDDFLTSGGVGGGEGSREDLIRKKLLESFYGSTSATAAAATAAAAVGGSDDVRSGAASVASGARQGEDAASGVSGGASRGGSAVAASASAATSASAAVPPQSHSPSSDDLDSPYFSAPSFAERHIRSSSARTLLEQDESLALDIRSLDSTMQTLVYENYSKFIDATDAIRSIGQSVDASEAGLARLRLGINRIEEGTRAVDAALRTSRDAVAEKIRVKRLLTRLDALLRLPKTLRTQIDAGRYRLAAKSHMSATAILGRHSAGFESLKSIEDECNAIMRGMMSDLRDKILHWSGEAQRRSSPLLRRRKHMLGGEGEEDADSEDSDGGFGMDGGYRDDDDDDNYSNDDDGEDDAEGDSGKFPDTPEPSKRRAPPLPPNNVAEIFECAGTLLLFSPEDGGEKGEGASAGIDHLQHFETGLSAAECKSLALDACGRLLERLLEAHNARMDEEAAEDGCVTSDLAEAGIAREGGPLSLAVPKGGHIVPTAFLDGVLESATLYGITLSGSRSAAELLGSAAASDLPTRSASSKMTPDDLRLLTDFVSTLFGSFLGHVRMALLECSIEGEERASRLADEGRGEAAGIGTKAGAAEARRAADEADEASFAEISSALVRLLRSVRELASGLALPEVGLDVEMASNLVDQTAEMSESIVRRRVGRKFVDLRARVARETLGPFVRDALAEPTAAEEGAAGSGGGGARVVRVVRVASVALSDGMQLADDAVRAMLSKDSVLGAPGAPVDASIVRLAVQRNARKFGMWLAAALEMLAGLDDPDPKAMLDVRLPRGEDETAPEDEGNAASSSKPSRMAAAAALDDEIRSAASGADNFGAPDEDDESRDLLEQILSDLEEEESRDKKEDLTLAIAELCRLAERTVPDAMNQSVSLTTEDSTRSAVKASAFFESSVSAAVVRAGDRSNVDPDGGLAARFRTAASRSLQLFASSRGSDAAAFGCADVLDVARASAADADGQNAPTSALPAAPSEKAWRILEVAKAACVDCAAVLGGDVRSGPVPPFPEDDDMGTLLMSGRAPLGGGGGGIKGLQLDVERMFTERVRVYPHPSRPMHFDRTAVVATVLKAAFRSMLETVRVCSFSAFGYRQLQVDCEFLRHVLTHYVRDENMADGTNPVTGLCNLLNDTIINAGERCLDLDCVGVSEYYDEAAGDIVTPLSIARRFMEEQEELGEDGVLSLFIINE